MNKFLEKIAKKKKEGEEEKLIKDLGAAGAATYGGLLAEKQYRRGNLTGREALFHGTDKDSAMKIRREGLKPQSVTKTTSGATSIVSKISPMYSEELLKRNKGLTFTAKKRSLAANYALQSTALSGKAPGVVAISAPVWKDKGTFKKVPNPEISLNPNVSKKIFGTDTFVNKGDIPTKYIKGSKDYKGITKKELKEFLSKNKKRAVKGYSKAAIGTALLAAGGSRLASNLKDTIQDGKRDEKS